jgi:PAS domain-containing protein
MHQSATLGVIHDWKALVQLDEQHSPGGTLRFIEEKVGLGAWSWDLKTRKMEWSTGFFHLLGLEPGSVEPSYAVFEMMVHPDDVRPSGEIEQILSQAGSIERSFRVVHGDGRVRCILNRGEVLLGRTGRPARAIGVIFDVTRLQEALSTIEMLRERHSTLAELTSAMTWTAMADATVADVLLRHKHPEPNAPEARHYSWLDSVHPDDRKAVCDAWDSAVAERRPFECEHRVHHGGGTYRWVRARAVPAFDKDGSIREWVGALLDIQDQMVWSPRPSTPTITGAQLRAARGILNWSVRKLSDAAHVSAATIRRLEESDGPHAECEATLADIRATLEQAGVEFLFPPLGKPGARPR